MSRVTATVVLTLGTLSVLVVGFGAPQTSQASRATSAEPAKPAETPLAREAQDALNREDWPSAIRDYEKLVKASPNKAEFHAKLGMAYFSSGRPQDAIPSFRAALKLDPTATGARDFLAASLAQSGQCQEAVPQLKKRIARVTDKNLKRSMEVGGLRCAMSLGQMDQALDFIKSLNRDFPRDPEVLYLTVHVFSDLSIQASQALLVSAPSSYQVHLLNAEALETQGKWEDAARKYRVVLERNPHLPGMHYRLGRLLLSEPKKTPPVEEAKHEFEEELKLSPGNAGAHYVLGELARQAQQWPQAIEHFSAAATLDAGFADAFIGLGRSLIAAGRAPEAIAPLEMSVKMQPQNPVAHFHLATAYRRAGRREDANREMVLHQQTSEKSRQAKEEIQAGVNGPQDALGPQKAEP